MITHLVVAVLPKNSIGQVVYQKLPCVHVVRVRRRGAPRLDIIILFRTFDSWRRPTRTSVFRLVRRILRFGYILFRDLVISRENEPSRDRWIIARFILRGFGNLDCNLGGDVTEDRGDCCLGMSG